MDNNYIEQKKNTHLYFQAGGNKYAINSNNVLEIMKLPALDYPQKLPHNIVGLLKYNNFVINVVDVRFYLNIDVKPYDIHNELLIVKTDEVIFGIITDKIIGILPFDTALTDHIPYSENSVIDAIYKFNEETIFIINVYSIENILKEPDNNVSSFDIPALFPTDKLSVDLMEKRTRAIVNKSANMLSSEELHAKNKYISFNLGNDFYCIQLDYIKEVLKDTPITSVPGTPDFIAGIMNLRGDYITVINLKKFLSLPDASENDKNPVIIVKCNELKLALLIDKINELFDYQDEALEINSDNFYANEFIYNNTLYTTLNIEKITSSKKIIVTDT